MEQKNRILIVEDDTDINNLLYTALQKAGYETVQAFSGTEARMLFQMDKAGFSLILLDLMLPGMTGEEVLEQIRQEQKKEMTVLILSAKVSVQDKVKLLRLGADDYITKPFNPLELVARVKSQLRRYTQLGNMNQQTAGQVYKCGGLAINDDNKEVTVDGELIKLTPIEYNILLLLVKNAGKVFSIDEIYEQIWNEEAIGADNTVAVHIRHIREKIEINPREPRYLKVVWGVGYKIEKQ